MTAQFLSTATPALTLNRTSPPATIKGMEPNPYEAPKERPLRLSNRGSQWEVAAKLGIIAGLVSLFVDYVAYNVTAQSVLAAEGPLKNSADSRHFEAGLLSGLVTLILAAAISVAGVWAYVRRL